MLWAFIICAKRLKWLKNDWDMAKIAQVSTEIITILIIVDIDNC